MGIGRIIKNLYYADGTDLVAINENQGAEWEKKRIYNKDDQLKTTGTSISYKAGYKDTEVVDSFCLLESTFNGEGTSNQDTFHRLAHGRTAMMAVEKKFLCWDKSIPTKIRIMKTMVFPMTLYRSKTWTLKKQSRKSVEIRNLVMEISENTMDSQGNEQMDHQTNQDISLQTQIPRLQL